MILVSRFALGATLSLGMASMMAVAPAAAQEQPAPKAPALTKDERAAILPLHTAVQAQNWAAARVAVPAAEAASKTPEARYLTAGMKLTTGLGANDVKMQAQAIDEMIQSGAAPAAALPQLYKNQGILASNAQDYERAEAAYTRWAQVDPNNTEAILLLAETKNSLKKPAEAVQLIQQAIAARKAAEQPVAESWYKRGLKLAYDGRMAPQSIGFSRDLVAAYPSPTNWRDALSIYRDIGAPDEAGMLDTLRLARAAKALSGERDYLELARILSESGLAGGGDAVLDEGVAMKMVDPTKPEFKELIAALDRRATAEKATLARDEKTALAGASGAEAIEAGDLLYGNGEYVRAAALYRAALQKGGADAGTANIRLGAALAMAGQKEEAEAAFRAVTGARTDLANFWIVWLNQRA